MKIPAADYEAHMRAVGQDEILRETFARVVAETRPARVAVLGCTTGADLALLEPTAIQLAVGVDLNPRYLEIAAQRVQPLGDRVRLICGDVADAELPTGPYDLVHAALLLEYVDPRIVFTRAHGWLGLAGTLSIITQEPARHLSVVSDTGYDSLLALSDRMTLRTADEVAAFAANAGFALAARRTSKTPGGKKLISSVFDKARAPLARRPREGRC